MPVAPLSEALILLAGLLVVLGLGYSVLMLGLSRGSRRPPSDPVGRPFFVFLLPCLNEERVIGNSVERLLSIDRDDFAVLVIDDGSDDSTADVVAGYHDERVWMLRRRLPHARKGKGAALNAAVRYLGSSDLLTGRDPDQVIVVILDADGRLDPDAMAAVTPYFDDISVGGVQIGVRINNRHTSLLARMQDMEFVVYTDVFQRARRRIGSSGMGGNGQFMRLSALRSLGPEPWSDSLTEDLDLGVRLLLAGWRNEYCHDVAVHQQGVVEFKRLVRQRTRWFQGHLQSWNLIPAVVREAPGRALPDLLYHLSSPALVLLASLLTLSFLLSLVGMAVEAAAGSDLLVGPWMVTTYLLSFGPAVAYGLVYRRNERQPALSVPRAVLLAHVYVVYGGMWFLAGWWAVARVLGGQGGWAKTERTEEPAHTDLAPSLTSVPTVATLPARRVGGNGPLVRRDAEPSQAA